MCQCGCTEYPVEHAYRLTDRCILGVKVYMGCRECFPGLAVDLSVYNSAKVEWLEHLQGKIDDSVKPSEYGGTNGACGIPIPLIDVDSLKEQALEMGADESIEEYGSLTDWLADEGFELLNGAARKFAAKHAAQIVEIESRKEKQ